MAKCEDYPCCGCGDSCGPVVTVVGEKDPYDIYDAYYDD